MSVLLAICLLMAGACIGVIIGALLSATAKGAKEERKRWWDEND